MISSREIANMINKELLFERNPDAQRTMKKILSNIEKMEDLEIEKVYQEHLVDEEQRKKELFEKISRDLQDAFTHA